eukprot:3785855-Karenia_brevis.AAC.1
MRDLKAQRAQDLARHRAYRHKNINQPMKIGTLNVTTLALQGQRQRIEALMQTEKIDVLAIQEAKIPHNSQENKQKYTWYFSGQDTTEKQAGLPKTRFDAGV